MIQSDVATPDCELSSSLQHECIASSWTIVDNEPPQNPLARINTLPFEILSVILREALLKMSRYGKDWRVDLVLRLCMVCMPWRQVLLAIPWAWSDVYVGHIDLARLCLRRAGNLPIEFTLADKCCRNSARRLPSPLNEGVDILIENIGRIRELAIYIHIESFRTVLRRLRNINAPMLRALVIRNKSTSIRPLSQRTFLLDANRNFPVYDQLFSTAPLRILTIYGLAALKPIITFTRLTSLELNLYQSRFDTREILFKTMHASPLLENIVIIISRGLGEYTHGTTVELRNLRCLTLHTSSARDVRRLLRRIVMPSLARTVILISEDGDTTALEGFVEIEAIILALPVSLRQSQTHVAFSRCRSDLVVETSNHAEPEGNNALLKVSFPYLTCLETYIESITEPFGPTIISNDFPPNTSDCFPPIISVEFVKALSEKLSNVLPKLREGKYNNEKWNARATQDQT